MMADKKKFPDFKMSENKSNDNIDVKEGFQDKIMKEIYKILDKIIDFCEPKLGSESKITKILVGMKKNTEKNDFDVLTQVKNRKTALESINLILTIALIIILFFSIKGGPNIINRIEKAQASIQKQERDIRTEQQNNSFLQRLQEDRNTLMENIYSVYAAVPDSDEKAEEVIAMIEDIATKNRTIVESIGIRELPETQMFYDDLIGVSKIYEYSFSVESGLPNILSFIGSLRSSLRLMDMITLEIEEGKESYKANFSVYVYHLIGNEEM